MYFEIVSKVAKGLTFDQLADFVGCHPVWLAAVCYRQASPSHGQSIKLLDALDLDHSLASALTAFPLKGGIGPVIPTDPLIYRFYEIMQVYGLPLKDVILYAVISETSSNRWKLSVIRDFKASAWVVETPSRFPLIAA